MTVTTITPTDPVNEGGGIPEIRSWKGFRGIVALVAAVGLAAGCGSMFEPSWARIAAFGPTPTSVRSLLDEDLVRPAHDAAQVLVRQYPGFLTELVLGTAMWRNGDAVGAEPRFRRASREGSARGHLGRAWVAVSTGDWKEATDYADAALQAAGGDADVEARALALLAALSWGRGRVVETRRLLSDWAERDPDLGRQVVARAAAAAVAELDPTRPAAAWHGGTAVLPVRRQGDLLVVAAHVGDTPAKLALQLDATQTYVSPGLVEEAGLSAHGADRPVALVAGARVERTAEQLHFAGRQAAVARLGFGAAEVRNLVVGVASPPDGVDGVLAADLLLRTDWGVDLFGGTLVLGGAAPDPAQQLLRPTPNRVAAWLRARTFREGLAVQLFLMPRLAGQLRLAGVDLGGPARLDPGAPLDRPGGADEAADAVAAPPEGVPGAAAAGVPGPARGEGGAPDPDSRSTLVDARLGPIRVVLSWERRDLALRAVGGGVAPPAVIGTDFFRRWTVHWEPVSGQFGLTPRDLPGPS